MQTVLLPKCNNFLTTYFFEFSNSAKFQNFEFTISKKFVRINCHIIYVAEVTELTMFALLRHWLL